NVASNWTPQVVPPASASELVNINPATASTVNFTSASDYSAGAMYWVRIFSAGTTTLNTVSQSGGVMHAMLGDVGLAGAAQYIQNGGTCTFDTSLYIAGGGGSVGTYQLNNGTLSAATLALGNNGGTGTFIQSRGFATASSWLF